MNYVRENRLSKHLLQKKDETKVRDNKQNAETLLTTVVLAKFHPRRVLLLAKVMNVLANSILHDSRLAATLPQISYETEDAPKSAENSDKDSPELVISKVMLNTITMPSTTKSVFLSTVFTSDIIIPVASTSRDTSNIVTEISFSLETLRLLQKLHQGKKTTTKSVLPPTVFTSAILPVSSTSQDTYFSYCDSNFILT